jgi:hypothetical protein
MDIHKNARLTPILREELAPTAKLNASFKPPCDEWAYARAYDNSQLRAAELPPGSISNWHRPHASLNHAPPISRSGLDRNNLLTHHT